MKAPIEAMKDPTEAMKVATETIKAAIKAIKAAIEAVRTLPKQPICCDGQQHARNKSSSKTAFISRRIDHPLYPHVRSVCPT